MGAAVKDVHYLRLSRQRGANLVELMIVLVLGLVITAGIYQLFSSNQRTYRLQNAISEVQENGRFLLDVFQRDLRHAGFAPACQGDALSKAEADAGIVGGLVLNLKDGKADDLFPNDRFDAVGGWESRGNDAYTSQVDSSNYQQGDLLLIHHAAAPAEQRLSQDVSADDQNVKLDNQDKLGDGDLLAFIEKNNCEIVEIPKNTDTELSVPGGVTYAFGAESTWIGKLQGSIYYIGQDTTRGEPGLMRLDLVAGGRETLASPVVDMKLRFLVGDEYVEAKPSVDWRNITAVRVSLLLRSSEENVLQNPSKESDLFGDSYDFEYAPADDDRRLYQVFTTTVALRNRLVEGR